MPGESILNPGPSNQLATYLFGRREAILNIWRVCCEKDDSLGIVVNMTREEFNDQVPSMLNLLERRLRNEPDEVQPHQHARQHGLHRWHKGYGLQEILSELSHLHQCLLDELHTFSRLYEAVDPDQLLHAHRVVAKLIHEAINGSTTQYSEFQKAEAVERANNLQRALDEVNQLAKQRGVMLRIASHDLRSSFSVIQGAASLLDLPDNTEQERAEMLQILNRNFPKLASMLTELMDLARLEAGRETVSIQAFDASELLRGLVESVQPLTTERELNLLADGPETLPVLGDPVKVYRIAQNLLLNAMNNTRAGQVSVSWSAENKFRWLLSIQDTGSGLASGPALWLSEQLKPTADSTGAFQHEPKQEPIALSASQIPSTTASGQVKGEGIGLYIVKRLCELLNASLDVETRSGLGTLIRIRFPSHYGE